MGLKNLALVAAFAVTLTIATTTTGTATVENTWVKTTLTDTVALDSSNVTLEDDCSITGETETVKFVDETGADIGTEGGGLTTVTSGSCSTTVDSGTATVGVTLSEYTSEAEPEL